MTRLLAVLSTGACHRSLGTPRDVWGVCNVYRAAPAWLVEGRCPISAGARHAVTTRLGERARCGQQAPR